MSIQLQNSIHMFYAPYVLYVMLSCMEPDYVFATQRWLIMVTSPRDSIQFSRHPSRCILISQHHYVLYQQKIMRKFYIRGLYYKASSTYPHTVLVILFYTVFLLSGDQLRKWTQVFPIQLWALSHKRGSVCSIWPKATMDKSTGIRAVHLTNEEQTIKTILETYEYGKQIIQP